jgi:hypothetical protein
MPFNNFQNIATPRIDEDAVPKSETALIIQTDDASRTRLVTGRASSTACAGERVMSGPGQETREDYG